MAPKKRPSVGAATSSPIGGPVTSNFRSAADKGRWGAKPAGTKPLPEPITVPEIFTKVILHGCRKILFLDPKIRIMTYAVMLFFFSLVSDYLPFPRTYFAYSDNIPNTYFVKFSWGWTFLFTGLFMYLTSAVYCCGDRKRILRHMGRLLVGTIIWFVWTHIFSVIEESTGQCLLKDGTSLYSVKSRRTCFSKNGKWTSFDISGHSFLLIWCVFVITEEAKAIVGWDGIKDLIRNEEHYRSKLAQPGLSSSELPTETSLSSLSEEEFDNLKNNFAQNDIFVKVALIGMTWLCVLWDFMVLMTAIYFHVMIEKVLGGMAAAFSWMVIYRGFYSLKSSPGLPGQGAFKYNFDAKSTGIPLKSSVSATAKVKGATAARGRVGNGGDGELPKFMGMPLTGLKYAKKDDNLDKLEAD
jgi:hypothetical protein